MSAKRLPDFFARNNFTQEDVDKCMGFAAGYCAGYKIEPVPCQGGCSFTLFATPRHCDDPTADDIEVIQFRLDRHAIPIAMAQEARRLYSPLVPATNEAGRLTLGDGAGVQASAMSYMSGTRLSDLLPQMPHLHVPTVRRLEGLMADRASFFSRSWKTGFKGLEGKAKCKGRVGSTIPARLMRLERELPSSVLRDRARLAREAFEAGGLDAIPVTLTCGDLIPSNLMVDPQTWSTIGYIDWAEVEWLPSGMSLYSLEHMLSYIDLQDGRPRVVFYEQANQLRDHYWTAVERSVPELKQPAIREAVTLSRDIGVLLWRGFAWDDGRIDRVVNSADDAEELARLEAYMAVPSAVGRRDSRLVGVNTGPQA